MSDDGYTLAEVLAALVILGLAFGGLAEGARVIGGMQTAATRDAHGAAAERSADEALGRLVEQHGPFISDGRGGFTGLPTNFSFDCDNGSRCGAEVTTNLDGAWLTVLQDAARRRIRLPSDAAPRFSYIDANGASPQWPVTEGRPRTLKAIVLQSHSEPTASLAVARLWVDESANCVFDSIAQDCRR